MNEDKITIGFEYADEFGNQYSAQTSGTPCEMDGEREIDFIGRQFLHFLRQVGYYIGNGEYMLMKGLSGDEYEFLSEQLVKYRKLCDEGSKE